MSRFVSKLSLKQVESLRAFWVQIDHDFDGDGFKIDREILDELLSLVQDEFHERTDTYRMAELLRKF